MDWPTGIKPRGKGLEVTIWKGKRRIYNKILPCDPHDPSDLSAAIRHRDDKVARLRAGLPLHDEARPDSPVFADVAQRYLNSLQIGERQIKNYTKYLNQYWMPHFGNWMVTDVTQAHIKEILAGMKVKVSTQRNRLDPLRGVLNHAGVTPNPAKGITWPRTVRKSQKKKVERYLPAQREKLVDALDKLAEKYALLAQDKPTRTNQTKAHWSAQARVYFPLLFATGLRPGEALGLDWADYSGDSIEVWKQRSDSELRDYTKTGDERTVYVPTWVRERIDTHSTKFKKRAIFLAYQGGDLAYTDELNKIWEEAHRKARIRYREPYTCRHTRAAEMLSRGVDPAEAATELGHSVQMFLDTYSQFIAEYRGERDMSRLEGAEIAGHTNTTQKSRSGK